MRWLRGSGERSEPAEPKKQSPILAKVATAHAGRGVEAGDGNGAQKKEKNEKLKCYLIGNVPICTRKVVVYHIQYNLSIVFLTTTISKKSKNDNQYKKGCKHPFFPFKMLRPGEGEYPAGWRGCGGIGAAARGVSPLKRKSNRQTLQNLPPPPPAEE